MFHEISGEFLRKKSEEILGKIYWENYNKSWRNLWKNFCSNIHKKILNHGPWTITPWISVIIENNLFKEFPEDPAEEFPAFFFKIVPEKNLEEFLRSGELFWKQIITMQKLSKYNTWSIIECISGGIFWRTIGEF